MLTLVQKLPVVKRKAQDSPCTRQERFQERDIQTLKKSSGYSPKHFVTQVKFLSLLMMELPVMIASKVPSVTAGSSVLCLFSQPEMNSSLEEEEAWSMTKT